MGASWYHPSHPTQREIVTGGPQKNWKPSTNTSPQQIPASPPPASIWPRNKVIGTISIAQKPIGSSFCDKDFLSSKSRIFNQIWCIAFFTPSCLWVLIIIASVAKTKLYHNESNTLWLKPCDPRRAFRDPESPVLGLLVNHNRFAAVTPGHTQVTHALTIEVKQS